MTTTASSTTSAIQKPRIAAALVEHADRRGWVDRTPLQMQDDLGIPEHEVVHALWDFQKQGWLKFREHKATQGAVELTALRVTSPGRKAMESMVEKHNGKPAEQPVEPEQLEVLPRSLTPEPNPWQPTLAEEFPMASALVIRRTRLEQAAALLEAAGQDELALTTLERANDPKLLSPLEAEAVALYRRVAGE